MSRRFHFIVAIMLIATAVAALPQVSWSVESKPQERLAYLELIQIRSMCQADVTYQAYRDALARARQYVGLLGDDPSTNAAVLRTAMGYYEQALATWSFREESDYPVDSLRSDEKEGAAILGQCPDIPHFHYKGREQIYVRDAVDCLWRKAAKLLDDVPADLH